MLPLVAGSPRSNVFLIDFQHGTKGYVALRLKEVSEHTKKVEQAIERGKYSLFTLDDVKDCYEPVGTNSSDKTTGPRQTSILLNRPFVNQAWT